MSLGLTDDQRLENYRIRFKLTHERIKELTSYIRITDAAIWGFLGFVFVEFFKDNLTLLPWKIPLFSIILIIAMFVWRYTVKKYQNNITEEYETIKNFEILLQFDKDKNSMTTRQKNDISNGRYVDREHLRFDSIAKIIAGVAVIILIAWIVSEYQIWLFSNSQ
jgi:hypothetical protein